MSHEASRIWPLNHFEALKTAFWFFLRQGSFARFFHVSNHLAKLWLESAYHKIWISLSQGAYCVGEELNQRVRNWQNWIPRVFFKALLNSFTSALINCQNTSAEKTYFNIAWFIIVSWEVPSLRWFYIFYKKLLKIALDCCFAFSCS